MSADGRKWELQPSDKSAVHGLKSLQGWRGTSSSELGSSAKTSGSTTTERSGLEARIYL